MPKWHILRWPALSPITYKHRAHVFEMLVNPSQLLPYVENPRKQNCQREKERGAVFKLGNQYPCLLPTDFLSFTQACSAFPGCVMSGLFCLLSGHFLRCPSTQSTLSSGSAHPSSGVVFPAIISQLPALSHSHPSPGQGLCPPALLGGHVKA